jgi:hypothetical protein
MRHYGFNCHGKVVPGPEIPDSLLPPCLASAQQEPDGDNDELPPWLGERMRDTTHDIHRAAAEAAQDSQDHAE